MMTFELLLYLIECNSQAVLSGIYFVFVVVQYFKTHHFRDICPNNKRDRATLERMVMRRVQRGATILTDKWGSYIGHEGLGNF